MPDAVIFDLDGVLVDSEQLWNGAKEAFVRETGGLYFVDMSDYRVRFNPDDMREYKPDYVPFKDYLESKRKNPLHDAIVKAAVTSQGSYSFRTSQTARRGGSFRSLKSKWRTMRGH